jgi:hypothetical protein
MSAVFAGAAQTAIGPESRAPGTSAVRIWLYVLAFLVVVMVGVGGATRLTGSGLSITEWKPVTWRDPAALGRGLVGRVRALPCEFAVPEPQSRHEPPRVQVDLRLGMGPSPARAACSV